MCFILYYFETGSLFEQEFTKEVTGWPLANHKDAPVSAFPAVALQMQVIMPGFLIFYFLFLLFKHNNREVFLYALHANKHLSGIDQYIVCELVLQ